jgi:excisionase family DNA binding protein
VRQLERQTLTVQEAGNILGISRSTAYEAVRRGELPVIRIGRRLVIPRVAVERLLKQAGQPGTLPGPLNEG